MHRIKEVEMNELKKGWILAGVMLASVLLACAEPESVEILPNGATRIPSAEVNATPIFFLPKSMGCAPYADEKTVPRRGQTPFGINTLLGSREKIFKGETSYSLTENGELAVRYRFVGVADTPATGLYASFPLMTDGWAGGKITFDDIRTVHLPQGKGVLGAMVVTARKATAIRPDGRTQFTVRFDTPQPFEVNDGRAWGGPAFVFRAKAVAKDRFTAGETNEIAYALSTPQGLVAKTGPVTLKADADWTPLTRFTPFINPGSALDWTNLRPTGQPAGKDGFLRTNGQDFEFERQPGKRVRFYGVNICGDMCWGLTDEEFDRFSANLARIGYNSLRIHHHDNGITTGPDKTELNATNMKRMDYLVKTCIDHGLYLTTDLYVSRSLTYRQLGIDRDGCPPYESIKPLFYVSEVAFSNFICYARNFLNHVNPYTGRRYADEPAMPLLSVVNEGSLGMDGMSGVRLFADIYRAEYMEWLRKKKAADPSFADVNVREPFPGNIYDGSGKDNQAFLLFCGELEYRFNERVRKFLRDEIRAKSLVTDMNINYNPAVYAKTRDAFLDYVDMHFYVDHPSFPEKAWSLPNYRLNASPLKDYRVGPKTIAPMRHLDRPFCVTEFNFCGPARLRSQSGITLGTVAGLQNWAGVWRFGWSHHVARHRGYAKEKMGGFDLVTDPTKIAEERAGLMLFAFGDLPEAKETSAVVLPREKFECLDGKGCRFIDRLGTDFLSYLRKVGIIVGDRPPQGVETLADWTDWKHPTRDETRERWYRDGIIRGPHHVLDTRAGSLSVHTPRVAGGFAERGIVDVGGFTARLHGSHAAVWANSVDGKPLGESDRIVVSHVTELQNSDSVFADLAHRYLLDRGRLPYIVRNGTADISIAVREGNWKVYALETSGKRRGEVPSVLAKGRLGFTADVARDDTNATFLYELVRESPAEATVREAVPLGDAGLKKGVVDSRSYPLNADWQWRWDGDVHWQTTDVPHDATECLPFENRPELGDHGYVQGGLVRYRKAVVTPKGAVGARLAVRFDGVYYNSRVFVNGVAAGGRKSGYLPFEVPIDAGRMTNLIEVAVDAKVPNTRWNPGAGILRNVSLVIRRGYSLEPDSVFIQTLSVGADKAELRILVEGAEIVLPKGGRLVIENPRLWSPDDPFLYDVKIVARCGGEEDSLTVPYGIRSFAFTKDRGFFLNGRHFPIRGVCQHEGEPCFGARLNEVALEYSLRELKKLGVNAIRTAHHPFPPEFYDLCDRMGFLVMDELFDQWREPKTAYGQSRFFDDEWRHDVETAVRRDRNHPSVILWSIGNEIPELGAGQYEGRHGHDGAKTAMEMRDIIRKLDPTRPITAGLNGPKWAEENGIISALDVCGLNYNPEFYDSFRGKYALVGSETAATYSLRDVYCYRTNGADLVIANHDGNLADARSMIPVWGVPAQGQEATLKRQISAPWSAGEFTWCSYDYLGEGSNPLSKGTAHWPAVGSSWGMFDFAGLPKDRAYLYQAMWTDEPMVHLLPDWTLPGCEGKKVPVWCYTNCDEAELYLNGVSQGVRRRADTADLHLVWTVPYAPGELRVEARRNGKVVAADERRTAGPKASVRKTVLFERENLRLVRFDAVDRDGNRVIACEDEIEIYPSEGEILAAANGSPLERTPRRARRRSLFRGSLAVWLRGGR